MDKLKAFFPENKRVDVEVGDFVIKTDQPLENGGDGEAPSPFDVFTSSMTACAGYFAKSFCDSRDIDTDDMKIEQEMEYNSEKGMLDKVEMTLFVGDDFPEKYRNAIKKSMSQCAVKRQLHPDIEFEIGVEKL